MRKSKRGIAIDEAVPLIVLIIVAVFGVFFFRACEAGKSDVKSDNVLLEKKLGNAHEVLMNYLQTIGSDGNKADFIAKSYLNDDIELLKTDLRQYLENRLSDAWRVEIVSSSGKSVLADDSVSYQETSARYLAANSVVPVNNGEYILIKLYIGEGVKATR